MFKDLFKRCPHEYKQVGFIPATTVGEDGISYEAPCYFLECKHCGKRKVLRESDYAYTDAFLDMIDLWVKHQFKINFKEYQKDELDCTTSTEISWHNRYEKILLSVQDELNKFNIPMHDSENRLVLNNVKGILRDVLSEEGPDEETK